MKLMEAILLAAVVVGGFWRCLSYLMSLLLMMEVILVSVDVGAAGVVVVIICWYLAEKNLIQHSQDQPLILPSFSVLHLYLALSSAIPG